MANGGQINYSIGFNVQQTELNQLKNTLRELQQMTAKDIARINFDTKDAEGDLERVKASVKELQNALNKSMNADLGTVNLTKFNKELKNMDLKSIYQNLSLAGTAGTSAFRNLTTGLLQTNVQIKQSNKFLNDMANTMKNTIKWGVASSVMNSFTNSVQQAYGYVKHLDSSLNDIRIVTGYSADEMDRFAEKANKAAKNLAASTTDYTEAALIYYQQGLAGDEVERRAETTLKTANVTGQQAAEVSEQLTAVWNGYKVSAEETEMYVDKLAAVAASTASDLEELSTGMSKVASAAATSGVDIDQLSATLSTVISVTRQAPESVGTAFKTIYARLGDLAVDGVDEFGTSLGQISSKMETMGIHILDETGNMRDMGTVVEEVAAKWDTWSSAQKQAAAVAMAGKRQYNNLIALFENWDMYEESLLTSQNSLGTLSQQQEIYLDSAEARLQQLKTSMEGVYDSLLDADTIKEVAGALTFVVSGFEKLIDGIGGGSTALVGLGAAFTKVFNKQLTSTLATTALNFQKMKDKANKLQQSTILVNQFKKSLDELGEKADKATRNIVNAYNDMLKASGSLSDEDIQKFNNVVKEYDNAATAMDRYRLAKEKAGSGMAAVTADTLQEGISDDDWQAIENRAENLQNKGITSETDLKNNNQLYQKFKNEVVETSKVLQSQGNDFKDNFDILKMMTSEVKEQKADFSTYEAEIEESRHAVRGFAEELSKNPLIKGTEVQKELDKIVQAMEQLPNEVNDDTEKIEQQLKEAFQDAVAAIKRELGEIDIALDQAATGQSKKIKEQFAAAAANMQEEGTKVNTTLRMQGVVDGIQNVEMLAFGIMAVSNGFKVLGDESLTAGEKIAQFSLALISGLSMGLPALTALIVELKTTTIGLTILTNLQSAFTLLFGVIKSGLTIKEAYLALLVLTTGKSYNAAAVKKLLITLTNKEATAEEKAIAKKKLKLLINDKLVISELKLSKVMQKATAGIGKFLASPIGKFALIAAAIGLITVAFVRMTNAEERATKKAAEAAQGLTRELERTQQVAADVQSGLESYESAVDTLNQLEQGTAKWNQQLLTANNEVLKLIEKFPGLAQYTEVGENGLITITPNGEEYLLEQTNEQLKTAQRNSMAGQMNYLNARNTEIQSEATEKAGGDALAIESGIDKGLREGLGFLEQTAEEMIASGVRADVTNAIVENSDVIAQAVVEIGANNAALEAYGEQITNLALGDDEIFKDLSKGDQDLVSAEYQKEYDKIYEDELKNAKRLSKKETREAYEGIIGATDSRKGDTKDSSQYLVNGEWTEDIANKTAEVAIASDNAANQLTDFTSNLSEAGEGLLYFKNQLLGKNNEDVLNEAGYTSRAAMTDEQANALMQMEKGSKYEDINLSNFSSADLKNMKKGVGGKDYNDYQISEELANEMGFYGAQAVEDYKQHIYDLIVAEQNARAEAEANKKAIGVDAIQDGGVVVSDRKANQLYDSVAWEGLAEGINPEEILGNIDWSQAPENETELQEWFGKQAQEGIQNANLDKKITDDGLDVAEVEEYGKHLQDIADISDEVSDSLDEDPLKAKEIAAEAKKASRGIEKLSETFETYADTLEEGNLTADDWTDAAAGIREGMSDILDLSEEDMGWMDDEFIANNLEDIKKAAEGDVDAIQRLWAEAGKQYLIDIDLDIPEDQFAEMQGMIDQVANEDLEIGATIDDSQYAMGLFNMMTSAGATAAEIQGTFDRIGWEPEVETRTITLSKSDIRKGSVTVPSQVSATADGEIVIDHQELPISSSLSAGDTFTYTVIKGKGGKGSFTPSMRRSTTASATSPKSSGGGGGGGGGSTPKKTIKTSEKKRDRYREVNNSLSKLSTELDRLAEKQEKLFGKDLLDNLNAQLDVLEQQVSVTKEKLAIAEQEAEEMRKTSKKDNYKNENGYTMYNDLGDFGIKFNENGEITNYQTIMKRYDNKIAEKEAQWNAMSAEEQAKNEKLGNEIDALKTNRDTLATLVEKYDTLIYDTIPGLVDEITQAAYDQIEIRFKAFHIEADLRLDLTEAYKDWEDFQTELAEYEFPDNLAKQTEPILESINNMNNSGLGDTLSNNLDTYVKVWKQYEKGNYSDTRFLAKDAKGKIQKDENGKPIVDEQAFLDAIQEDMENAEEFILDQEERFKQIHENYLDGIDAVGEAYEEELEVLEYIGNQLEHNARMTELLKGDEAYSDIATNLIQQKANLQDMASKYAEAMAYYKTQMEAATDEEAKKKWREMYLDAAEQYEETLANTAEIIQQEFENAVKLLLQEFDESIGGVNGTRKMKAQWEIETENDEKYLDTVEKTFELANFSNKVKKGIADTDSISAQRRLNSLLDDQLEKLREKDKLTKYDVERANALYEIELKKIALEEAQNNKSQMRLRRDASGNYSYQFVADEDATADAQQELLDAQNSLYMLDKNTLQERQQELLDVYQQYQDLAIEYSQLSKEEREKYAEEYAMKRAALEQQMVDLGAEAAEIQVNISQSAAEAMMTAYTQMGENASLVMNENILPTWTDGLDAMISKINAEDGSFQASLNALWENIGTKSAEASTQLGGIVSQFQTAFTEANAQAAAWQTSAEATTLEMQSQVEELKELNDAANDYKEIWDDIKENILDSLEAAQNLSTTNLKKEANKIKSSSSKSSSSKSSSGKSSSSKSSKSSSSKSSKSKSSKSGSSGRKSTAPTTKKKQGGSTSKGKTTKTAKSGRKSNKTVRKKATKAAKSNLKKTFKKVKKKLKNIFKFDTGGYTGDWSGKEGKVALLHKKELVLNQKDTENLLKAVQALRQYSDEYYKKSSESKNNSKKRKTNKKQEKTNINSKELATSVSQVIDKNLKAMTASYELKLLEAKSLTKDKKSDIMNIEIKADFPNATKAAEIEKAFEQLTNIATQRAYSNKKK